jgi:F-type H+-transporting ATPase subunit O
MALLVKMNTNLRVFQTAARFLSSKAGPVSHAPPKKIHGTVGKYAEAVYTAASKIKALDTVETELKAFRETISKSVALSDYLKNPTIPRPDKVAQMGDIFDEKKFSYVTRNLFMTMAANGRVGDSVKVIDAFEELMQASRGAVKVTIISAESLKKKQLDTIQAGIMSMIGAGTSVEVETKVDESIMGGLQILVGDKFLDLSVASRVAELSKSLDSAN